MESRRKPQMQVFVFVFCLLSQKFGYKHMLKYFGFAFFKSLHDSICLD